eukprot:6486283-Amphidinium_carterae.1
MWSHSVHSLVAGPSKWLKNTVYFTREVLGWPVSLPSLQVVSLECKLRRAMKVEPRQVREFVRLRQATLGGALPQLATWCQSGCIASWTSALNEAHRRGWSALDRVDGKKCWVYTAEWTSVRKSIRTSCIGSERAAEDALAMRLVERMKGEPLMREFESRAFTRAFFKVSRSVKKVCGSSACVALCRLFLGGVSVPSKHQHSGGCCVCMQWHTGGLEAIIARGCFRVPLSAFRALAWLKDEPPPVLPLLIVRNAQLVNDGLIRRLGTLARVIVEVLHTCRHRQLGNELIETA